MIYKLCLCSINSGCDACEDWYHGDCIGITRKQSKLIKHYFCDVCFIMKVNPNIFTMCNTKFHILQKCKKEDPSLKTVFKTSLSRSELKEKNDQFVEIKRGKLIH